MYNYQTERKDLFTEDGQKMFLKIRDRINEILPKSGVVRMEVALHVTSGSTWQMMACVDRMVELGELREIKQEDCAGQHRIFVSTK